MEQFNNEHRLKAHDAHSLFNYSKYGEDDDNRPVFPIYLDFEKDPNKRIINDLTREYNNIISDYTAYIFKDPDNITDIRGY